MFMASVCALQEQLRDPFGLIVCLFDYLFTWRLFIYMHPYFLIIMYLFTGSRLTSSLIYIVMYLFIRSLFTHSFSYSFIRKSLGLSHMNTFVFLSRNRQQWLEVELLASLALDPRVVLPGEGV